MAVKAQKKAAKPSAKSSGRKSASTARKAAAPSRSTTKRATVKKPSARTSKPVKAKTTSKPATARPARANGAGSRSAASGAGNDLGKLMQVALTAKDLDATIAFYSNVLGLKLIARVDAAGFAFFNLGGGTRLMVSATASEASLYFHVDKLDASVKALKRRGVKFLQKPAMIHRDEAGEFGKKGVEEWMAFFHDPSGNLLALVERR